MTFPDVNHHFFACHTVLERCFYTGVCGMPCWYATMVPVGREGIDLSCLSWVLTLLGRLRFRDSGGGSGLGLQEN